MSDIADSSSRDETGSLGSGGHSGSSKSRVQKDNPSDSVALRRKWNRENAKKSRLRKKFWIDSLEKRQKELVDENAKLKQFIEKMRLGSPKDDFELVSSIDKAQRHFIITDATLPDNPIIFASGGFFELTQYSPSEILGRNCRMLQGPDTDPETVQNIREAVSAGMDCHAVVLNYTKHGTPFWNDLFIAPLRNIDGRVVNFVGVQANVTRARARKMLELIHARKGTVRTHQAADMPSERERRSSPAATPPLFAPQMDILV